jgi:glycine cleavage system H lipoate-binding protein
MTQPKPQKCIWMEAGVVPYKLCPLQYDCDRCEFYHRITRKPFRGEAAEKDVKICLNRARRDAFRPGIQYYANHIWLKHTGRNQVLLGLDECLIALLCSMERIIPAVLNHPVKADHSLAWIQFAFGVLYLNSPVSGTVIAHNPDLKSLAEHSEELDEIDFERYWLVKLNVEKKQLDRSRWLTKNQYLAEVNAFWETIHSQLKANLEIDGFETAADGGEFHPDIAQAIIPIPLFRTMIRQTLKESHKII